MMLGPRGNDSPDTITVDTHFGEVERICFSSKRGKGTVSDAPGSSSPRNSIPRLKPHPATGATLQAAWQEAMQFVMQAERMACQ